GRPPPIRTRRPVWHAAGFPTKRPAGSRDRRRQLAAGPPRKDVAPRHPRRRRPRRWGHGRRCGRGGWRRRPRRRRWRRRPRPRRCRRRRRRAEALDHPPQLRGGGAAEPLVPRVDGRQATDRYEEAEHHLRVGAHAAGAVGEARKGRVGEARHVKRPRRAAAGRRRGGPRGGHRVADARERPPEHLLAHRGVGRGERGGEVGGDGREAKRVHPRVDTVNGRRAHGAFAVGHARRKDGRQHVAARPRRAGRRERAGQAGERPKRHGRQIPVAVPRAVAEGGHKRRGEARQAAGRRRREDRVGFRERLLALEPILVAEAGGEVRVEPRRGGGRRRSGGRR
ncbi:hypothetical protein BU14_1280s0002, partial [Porphyra umbilicalis]